MTIKDSDSDFYSKVDQRIVCLCTDGWNVSVHSYSWQKKSQPLKTADLIHWRDAIWNKFIKLPEFECCHNCLFFSSSLMFCLLMNVKFFVVVLFKPDFFIMTLSWRKYHFRGCHGGMLLPLWKLNNLYLSSLIWACGWAVIQEKASEFYKLYRCCNYCRSHVMIKSHLLPLLFPFNSSRTTYETCVPGGTSDRSEGGLAAPCGP